MFVGVGVREKGREREPSLAKQNTEINAYSINNPIYILLWTYGGHEHVSVNG